MLADAAPILLDCASSKPRLLEGADSDRWTLTGSASFAESARVVMFMGGLATLILMLTLAVFIASAESEAESAGIPLPADCFESFGAASGGGG